MISPKFFLDSLRNVKKPSILLTGGCTASSLYRRWSQESLITKKLENAQLYFGDERCVSLDDPASNYRLVVDELFSGTAPDNLFRIRGEVIDYAGEVYRYASLFPDYFDFMIFSVGEDGHIASLFPNSAALASNEQLEYVNDAPKLPACRFTITPRVIHIAKQVVVMAAGAEKGKVLAQALRNPSNFNELPVRLTIGGTWILDEEATQAFRRHSPENHHDTKIIYA